MAGESLDGFRSFQDVRLYHALERLESTVESMANLASAVLQIPEQAFALKYKAKPSFMDSRPHGNLKRLESLVGELPCDLYTLFRVERKMKTLGFCLCSSLLRADFILPQPSQLSHF